MKFFKTYEQHGVYDINNNSHFGQANWSVKNSFTGNFVYQLFRKTKYAARVLQMDALILQAEHILLKEYLLNKGKGKNIQDIDIPSSSSLNVSNTSRNINNSDNNDGEYVNYNEPSRLNEPVEITTALATLAVPTILNTNIRSDGKRTAKISTHTIDDIDYDDVTNQKSIPETTLDIDYEDVTDDILLLSDGDKKVIEDSPLEPGAYSNPVLDKLELDLANHKNQAEYTKIAKRIESEVIRTRDLNRNVMDEIANNSSGNPSDTQFMDLMFKADFYERDLIRLAAMIEVMRIIATKKVNAEFDLQDKEDSGTGSIKSYTSTSDGSIGRDLFKEKDQDTTSTRHLPAVIESIEQAVLVLVSAAVSAQLSAIFTKIRHILTIDLRENDKKRLEKKWQDTETKMTSKWGKIFNLSNTMKQVRQPANGSDDAVSQNVSALAMQPGSSKNYDFSSPHYYRLKHKFTDRLPYAYLHINESKILLVKMCHIYEENRFLLYIIGEVSPTEDNPTQFAITTDYKKKNEISYDNKKIDLYNDDRTCPLILIYKQRIYSTKFVSGIPEHLITNGLTLTHISLTTYKDLIRATKLTSYPHYKENVETKLPEAVLDKIKKIKL